MLCRPPGHLGYCADESLLGIDFRPAQPDQLFGLSSFGQLYRLSASGSATEVGTAAAPEVLALAGGSYGFDFNPAVDRLRLVSDVGENARLHPDTGAVVDADMDAGNGTQVDSDLTYATGDANEGNPAGVTAVAYSNSAAGVSIPGRLSHLLAGLVNRNGITPNG